MTHRSEALGVARNSVYLGASQMLSQVLAVLLIVIITQYLGDAGFGRFSFALAFVRLFMFASDFGMASLVTRDVARKPTCASRYLGASLFAKTFTTLVAISLLAIATLFIDKSSEVMKAILVYSLYLLLSGVHSSFISIFRGLRRMEYESYSLVAERLFVLVLTYLALSHGGGIVTLAWIYVSGRCLDIFILGYNLTKKGIVPVFKSAYSTSIRMVKESWPFALLGSLSNISFEIGIVLMGLFWTDNVVGVFSAALRIITSLLIIPGILYTSTYPLMSKFHGTSRTSLKQTLSLSIKIVSYLGLPLMAGGLILAQPLIMVLFGPAFVSSVIIFQILILSIPLLFIRVIIYSLLNSTNRQRTSLNLFSITASVAFVFMLLLIPAWGGVGAAVSIFISEFVGVLIVTAYINANILKIHLLVNIMKSGVASLGMAAIVWLVKGYGIFMSIPTGILSYVFFVLLVNPFTSDEWKILREVKGIFNLYSWRGSH